MLCSKCKKNQATKTYDSMADGKKHTAYYCAECYDRLFARIGESFGAEKNSRNAAKIGGASPAKTLLSKAELVLNGGDRVGDRPDRNGFTDARREPKPPVSTQNSVRPVRAVCPVCGTSEAEFLATGLLGCAECYFSLKTAVLPVVSRLQGGKAHCGRGAGNGEEGRK